MSTRIHNLPRFVRGAGHPLARDAAFVAAVLDPRRGTGRVVTDHRTSWVRERRTPHGAYYVKVYEYATWASRLRDFARRTGPWSRSRAAAEFDALAWMRRHDLPAPEPILVGEERTGGFLRRAVLVTAAFPGETLDRCFARLQPGERRALAEALGNLVGRLHVLGFRDGNLDLRNLLAHHDDATGWVVAKIDSPRHRLRRPGPRRDRGWQADWARLLPQLSAFGVEEIVRAAAATAR
ncbi:MAG: phosphotransferase [Planctomycetes bacterium]|nr:phosphotransferase [Planctomycetota bacterium]